MSDHDDEPCVCGPGSTCDYHQQQGEYFQLRAEADSLRDRLVVAERERNDARRVTRSALEMLRPAFEHLRRCTDRRPSGDEMSALARSTIAEVAATAAPGDCDTCNVCGGDAEDCDSDKECIGARVRALAAPSPGTGAPCTAPAAAPGTCPYFCDVESCAGEEPCARPPHPHGSKGKWHRCATHLAEDLRGPAAEPGKPATRGGQCVKHGDEMHSVHEYEPGVAARWALQDNIGRCPYVVPPTPGKGGTP